MRHFLAENGAGAKFLCRNGYRVIFLIMPSDKSNADKAKEGKTSFLTLQPHFDARKKKANKAQNIQ